MSRDKAEGVKVKKSSRIAVFLILLLVMHFSMWTKMVFANDKIAALMHEGTTLHDKGDYKGAIEKYQEAIKIEPENMTAFYEMSFSYFASADYNKAIEYCDKILNSDSTLKEMAYVNKGSALDEIGKSRDAVQLYRDALKIYPESQILYYNSGLTYYRLKMVVEAEKALIDSLKRNPNHAGSHLTLGKLQFDQGRKVKGILALYNFLLLEPNSKRTIGAYKMLQTLLTAGVSKQGKESNGKDKRTIACNIQETDKDFLASELFIQLLEAGKNEKQKKGMSEQEWFVAKTEAIFAMLGELKKDNKGFWWDFYVDFFNSLAKENLTETLCYYISMPVVDEKIIAWLRQNRENLDKLHAWCKNYKRNEG
jgi:tetratricopeptide (TPR) repeat protein